MERKRIALDNPIFAGTLRQGSRSVPYARRPTQPATMSDMVAVRRPQHVKHVEPTTRVQLQVVAARSRAAVPKPASAPVQLRAQKIALPLQRTVPTAHKAVTKPAPEEYKERVSQVDKAEPVAQVDATYNETPTYQKRFKLRMPALKNAMLYGMAGTVFVAGIAVSFSGFQANHKVAAQVKQSQAVSTATTDSNHTAPSTVKPTDEEVRRYAVSPNLPRYIDIPKLKVHTRTLSEGVDRGGELQVPWNIYDTGWYNASSQPGQNGAMLVDGHSGIGKTHGVFNQLATLVAGDPIVVTRGDGQTFTYKVAKVQIVDANKVDMGSMLVSANTAKPGLNLITCTGDQIPGTTELNKRVQVYAVMQ